MAKYVITECGFAIFSENLVHADIAKAMSSSGDVQSAGFLSLDTSVIEVYGESISLDVASQPDDSILLKKLLQSE
jgi:hypothetical protein